MIDEPEETAEPLCFYCGEVRVLELFEWWPEERAFMLETCCEGYHAAMLDELADLELADEKEWRRGFAEWFAGETGAKARRPYVSETEAAIRLDYGLELREITRDEAKAFVLEHHRHNRPPCGWKWGHAVYNGADLIGVAMVGRPVARMIDATTTVEVNRVCVREDLDAALRWNACSMLYGAAAREAKKRGLEKVITYTLEAELGTTLKAVGWDPVATTKGGSWNRPSRAREDTAPTCKKVRWEKRFRLAA